MAAESFCKVGVIGTEGEGDAVDDDEVEDGFELCVGGGSRRQNVPE